MRISSRRMPALERLFARCFSLTETSAWAFHNLEGLLPICAPVDAWSSPHLLAETPPERGTLYQEANMGEVIRFVSKAERERLRLIREARAMYGTETTACRDQQHRYLCNRCMFCRSPKGDYHVNPQHAYRNRTRFCFRDD